MTDPLAAFIAERRPAMMELLRRLTAIQSGTRNKPGVDAMARAVEEAFTGSSYSVERHPHLEYGDMLLVSSPACRGEGHILLVGHMDTVFPADTAFTWWREEEGRINAPGCYDMKGGLAVGIFALQALAARGLASQIPLRFLFNSEEEVGSPASRPLIAREARRSRMAFVLEGGGRSGGLVTGRKGRWGVRVEERGRAGHAAKAAPDKASAVVALARHVLEMEELNGSYPGVTLNVGRVEGGIGPNTVPERCVAEVDVRFVDPGGEAWIEERLGALLAEPALAGTSATLATVSRRPPMPASEGNRALYRIARAQAEMLGIEVEEEHRAGVSDANLIAAEGTPVLDGLGPVGELDHSDREYILADTLVGRCQLLALTLVEAWRQGRGVPTDAGGPKTSASGGGHPEQEARPHA